MIAAPQPTLLSGATFRASVLALLTEPRTVPELCRALGVPYSLAIGDEIAGELRVLADCGLVGARVRDPDPDGCGSTEHFRTEVDR